MVNFSPQWQKSTRNARGTGQVGSSIAPANIAYAIDPTSQIVKSNKSRARQLAPPAFTRTN
jgi:hypothetical protein